MNKKQVAKGIKDVEDNATVASKLVQQAQKLDPAIIGSAPVKSPDENQLEDNSGELTYDDLDKEAPDEEQVFVEDIEQANTSAVTKKQKREADNIPEDFGTEDEHDQKSDDTLDNPMAGAEWGGLENNDDM